MNKKKRIFQVEMLPNPRNDPQTKKHKRSEKKNKNKKKLSKQKRKENKKPTEVLVYLMIFGAS